MGMGFDRARHLLSRAGFGGGPAEIEALARLDVVAGVDGLLKGVREVASVKPPSWVHDDFPGPDEMERKEKREVSRERTHELRAWWYDEMVSTPSPLTERLTLFWHNHFTSSARKVKWIPFMARQNALLRRRAAGRFSELLVEIAQDPAMLLYLDNQSSHKHQPNENFARELLELFTLGEGHYAERDIKEAARAFTGWRMRRRSGEFRFVKADHDDGQKVFLGERGAWTGDDILRILLKNPRTAEHIVEKLWAALISDEPDRDEVRRLARGFREGGYAMKPLLRAILTSEAFMDPRVRGAMIKSPVDLLVGTVRVFKIPIEDTSVLGEAGAWIGQDLLSPPNVKGWPGGARWITTHTLLARHEILERAARKALDELSLAQWLGQEGLTDRQAAERAGRVLLPAPPVRPVEAGRGEAILTQLVLDPTFQLK